MDLPPADSVTTLEHAGTTYYVVGTAHVSQRSVDEVRHVIEEIKPDVVCVELDKARHDALTKDRAFRDLDVFKVVRRGRDPVAGLRVEADDGSRPALPVLDVLERRRQRFGGETRGRWWPRPPGC